MNIYAENTTFQVPLGVAVKVCDVASTLLHASSTWAMPSVTLSQMPAPKINPSLLGMKKGGPKA